MPRRSLTAAALALALVTPLAAAPAASAQEGPVVGMPPIEDAVQGWVANWMHPDFWSSYVHDAAVNRNLNLPSPERPGEAGGLPAERAGSRWRVRLRPAGRAAGPVGHHVRVRGPAKTIEQLVRTTRTDQVVLVKNGTVIGEFYANGHTADVRYQVWSVTKTLIAFCRTPSRSSPDLVENIHLE